MISPLNQSTTSVMKYRRIFLNTLTLNIFVHKLRLKEVIYEQQMSRNIAVAYRFIIAILGSRLKPVAVANNNNNNNTMVVCVFYHVFKHILQLDRFVTELLIYPIVHVNYIINKIPFLNILSPFRSLMFFLTFFICSFTTSLH